MPINLPDNVTHNNPAFPIVLSEDLGGTARVINGVLNNTNLLAISSFKRAAGTIIFSITDLNYYRYTGTDILDANWGNTANWVVFTSSLIWSNITGTPTTISGYGITDAVPSSRTLTINGTSYDLSADRSWTIATTKAKRHEFVSADSTDYCGTAPEGSSESATVWTIKKLVIASSGTPTITTATNVAWTNRLTSTYI